METKETIVNEEVVEAAEEIVKTGSSGNKLKIVAGIGVAVLAGGLAYKYLAKPMVARFKVWRKEHHENSMRCFDDVGDGFEDTIDLVERVSK